MKISQIGTWLYALETSFSASTEEKQSQQIYIQLGYIQFEMFFYVNEKKKLFDRLSNNIYEEKNMGKQIILFTAVR